MEKVTESSRVYMVWVEGSVHAREVWAYSWRDAWDQARHEHGSKLTNVTVPRPRELEEEDAPPDDGILIKTRVLFGPSVPEDMRKTILALVESFASGLGSGKGVRADPGDGPESLQDIRDAGVLSAPGGAK